MIAVYAKTYERARAWLEENPQSDKTVILTNAQATRGRYLNALILLDPPTQEILLSAAPCLISGRTHRV